MKISKFPCIRSIKIVSTKSFIEKQLSLLLLLTANVYDLNTMACEKPLLVSVLTKPVMLIDLLLLLLS